MSAAKDHFVQVGAGTTSEAEITERTHLDVGPYIGENGYVQNAGFILRPIAALEKRNMAAPAAIVLHRTNGSSVEGALNSANSGIGTHFYVDKDGTVYQTASLLKHTSHVG